MDRTRIEAGFRSMPQMWCDGLLGQEDELDDVHDGKLDPPTDDEGPGSIDDKNDGAVTLERQDEDDELIEDEEADGAPRIQ